MYSRKWLGWVGVCGMVLTCSMARAADMGTAFTYQGFLENGSPPAPVDDTCDFRFQLYDAAAGGNLKGANPQNKLGVTVDGGVFTVPNLDFGPNGIDGTARWLEIELCCPSPCAVEPPLIPRVELTPAPHALALPGLYTQQNPTSPNLIGGYSGNTVIAGAVGVTIAGGGNSGAPNTAGANFATIGGGVNNQAGSAWDSIGGGVGNVTGGSAATVAGGAGNQALGTYATIGGGSSNKADAVSATVGGGETNTAGNGWATVSGGQANTASGPYSTVGGGFTNTATGLYSTLAGGAENQSAAGYTAIGGGWGNRALNLFATIAGGGPPGGGGFYCTAGPSANEVCGRCDNYKHLKPCTSDDSCVGGTCVPDNALCPDSECSSNLQGNVVTEQYGTIGGGSNNVAHGAAATVSGGDRNRAMGSNSAVGGGQGNVAGSKGSCRGGPDDGQACIGDADCSLYYCEHAPCTTVAGGCGNVVNGRGATVPGGAGNEAGGDYSLAAGRRAKARDFVQVGGGDTDGDEGTFIWADSTPADFTSSGPNQFLIRASGGMWFGTTSAPSIPAGRFINTSTGGYLTTGGVWTDSSDRGAKENFEPLDAQVVLDRLTGMPITRWNFKVQGASARHIGPTAQDFHAAFGTGEDDTHLAPLDTAGVALAAIQGLYQIVQEKGCEIDELREQKDRELAELREKMAELEAMLNALTSQNAGGSR